MVQNIGGVMPNIWATSWKVHGHNWAITLDMLLLHNKYSAL